jgi:S1-C subfamily serine protease
MDRIVVSPAEIATLPPPVAEPPAIVPRATPPIRLGIRLLIWASVIALPLVCLLSVIMRVIVRNAQARVRLAWLALLNSVLITSGMITSIAFVAVMAISPDQPAMLSDGLNDLDSRTSFSATVTDRDLSAEDVAGTFKPLVTVISPPQRRWLSTTDAPSGAFGAGIVVEATQQGYLIATARHVVDGDFGRVRRERALVASRSGTWASAEVIARHTNLDLLLLWLPRVAGNATFALPVAALDEVKDGSPVFVIGHPQGLRFTLSTGIVSRKDQDTIQTTAPVSPGNSGGPMLDSRGRLAGIVTSMVDRNQSPNAEGLNFAVRADALLNSSGWSFSGSGRKYLEEFQLSQPKQKADGKVN